MTSRAAGHKAVKTALSRLDDRRLAELVGQARPLGSGIGGTSALLDVEGVRVFVKRVPLTDLERLPGRLGSTANVFGLPVCYQYGIGSAGFGAWRELAAHVLTTDWVLGGHSPSFPLLHQWRVLPRTATTEPGPGEPAELERAVAFWDGSPAVRARLEAVANASADVVLFLEYVPWSLHDWLAAQVALGDEAVEAACALVGRELGAAVSAMGAGGLHHFDVHFRNVLTDGEHLYVGDFGLAVSPRFALSREELGFLAANATHDRHYAAAQWVNWLVTALCRPPERNEFIRYCAEGGDPGYLVPSAAAAIRRHARETVVVNDFYRRLYLESRGTPYPAELLS
ncbi:hypothetical protein [Prauserella flavalba]|uniref:hypothetical protein n=1 Tax=Prauserella flavalba TaxID=1477506 RepID=UPI001AEFAD25|nr:hypothetical protein [Prauserella flavalba]